MIKYKQMLLKNKSNIREIFNKEKIKALDIQDRISQNNIDYQSNDTIDDTINESLYTTTNITLDTPFFSNFEYNGIPSRSSIANIINIDNKSTSTDYVYKHHLNISHPSSNQFDNKIMIYTANNQSEIPFLLYLFEYDTSNKCYSFFETIVEKYDIKKMIEHIICIFKCRATYSGYLIHNKTNYLFFDLSDYNYNEAIQILDKKYIWATISEIINYKYVYDIPIDSYITSFFLKYNHLLNLYVLDLNSIIYETPIIHYMKTNNIDKKQNRYAIFIGSDDSSVSRVSNVSKQNYYLLSSIYENIYENIDTNKEIMIDTIDIQTL